ncbi:MAG: cation diffusion facilitator family transporter [Muribaculaceae bacterium]|nr:cation diffusion facilitator family transporter [Muribaculaceae bacterium]
MKSQDKTAVATIRKVTMVGFWINALLVVLKLFFGYWGKSDALVADGYHSVSDFVTDIIVIVFAGIAYKSADTDHPYGHGKFETLASLIIGIILMGVAVFLGYEGMVTITEYLRGHTLPKPEVLTIVVAIVSIFLKEYCFRYTRKNGLKIGSNALLANAEHHRSDAVSSIATVIGVTLSFALGESWRICDPIASIIISIMIAYSAVVISREALNELLEISLPGKEISEIAKISNEVEGVRKIHNLRGRRNGHSKIIEMNVHVDPEISVRDGHTIANKIEKEIQRQLGHDVIIYIHIEPDSNK